MCNGFFYQKHSSLIGVFKLFLVWIKLTSAVLVKHVHYDNNNVYGASVESIKHGGIILYGLDLDYGKEAC